MGAEREIVGKAQDAVVDPFAIMPFPAAEILQNGASTQGETAAANATATTPNLLEH